MNTIKDGELLAGFYEDDGSALWIELGKKDGERVRFDLSAIQFSTLMGQLTDLQYQVQEAERTSIETHAASALHSYGEHAMVAIGGKHVVAKFRVSTTAPEQAFAIPSERVLDFARLLERCSVDALASSKKSRH